MLPSSWVAVTDVQNGEARILFFDDPEVHDLQRMRNHVVNKITSIENEEAKNLREIKSLQAKNKKPKRERLDMIDSVLLGYRTREDKAMKPFNHHVLNSQLLNPIQKKRRKQKIGSSV